MEIKDIKEKLTIGVVLNHYGIKINKNNHCSCPFHDDKKPSMQVYAETNTVHCFSGNCEQTGKAIDVIDFILHKEKCTKHEAIIKAKQLIGVEPIEKTNQKHEPKPDLTKVFTNLQECFKRSKTAQSYLKERNLTTTEIGFNTKNIFNKMVQCIIFPLKDSHGQTVSFYGRHINREAHYYLTNRTGLYPSYPSQETKHLIITESVIDALTVKTHTSYEVLAIYGTNGLTPEHTEAIQASKSLQEITLFLDGDEAGITATAKYTRKLQKLFPSLIISKVETPKGEDPNSLIQGHEPEILNHLIENRTLPTTEVESLDTQLVSTPEPVKFSPKG